MKNAIASAETDYTALMPDRKLDIRGLVCPYTFVKAKLAIESMKAGELLEVILDYSGAVQSISKAMTEHGHAVLRTEKIDNHDWILLLRKGSE
jgi:TusA-related sulfurtransferase